MKTSLKLLQSPDPWLTTLPQARTPGQVVSDTHGWVCFRVSVGHTLTGDSEPPLRHSFHKCNYLMICDSC